MPQRSRKQVKQSFAASKSKVERNKKEAPDCSGASKIWSLRNRYQKSRWMRRRPSQPDSEPFTRATPDEVV